MFELKDPAEAYIRDLLVGSGLYDGSSDKYFWRSETSAKPIGTSVFEEVEESYKTFAKDNDISLKDQRVRRVDHKLLHDLLNEALSTVLEPHRGISTVSKVERKSMNSSSFPTLHENKLLNCVWEIICDHLYPSTDRSCYSLEDMVARDLRLSPWTREVDDEGTSLGREVEILILGDLVDEILKDMKL
ncbi:hypothetical protein CsatB_023599 [Cannabis sativa]